MTSSGKDNTSSESIDDITKINLDDLFSGKTCGSPKSKEPSRRSASKKQPARKRKPMKRLSIPLEQLLNGDDPWAPPITSAPITSIPATSTPTSLSLAEARLKNYMNESFDRLKEDFSYHLRDLLEASENTNSIVNTFMGQFIKDLKEELVIRADPLNLPDIDFTLDIALPFSAPRTPPSVRHLISEFSARRSVFPQNFESKRAEVAKEASERDAAQKEADAAQTHRRREVNKLRRMAFELETRHAKRNTQMICLQNERKKLEQKIEDFEAIQARQSDHRDSLLEIKDEFAQFTREISLDRATSLTQRMMSKIGNIVDESVDLRSVRHALAQVAVKVSENMKLESQFGVIPPRRAGTPTAGGKGPFVDITNQLRQPLDDCDKTPPHMPLFDFRMDQRFAVPLTSYA